MAHDLAERLLPAFDKTDTGIPFPRVNLRHGLPEVCMIKYETLGEVTIFLQDGRTTTCTAGGGSLLLEFSLLSRLLGDPIYEIYARRAVAGLYARRCNDS